MHLIKAYIKHACGEYTEKKIKYFLLISPTFGTHHWEVFWVKEPRLGRGSPSFLQCRWALHSVSLLLLWCIRTVQFSSTLDPCPPHTSVSVLLGTNWRVLLQRGSVCEEQYICSKNTVYIKMTIEYTPLYTTNIKSIHPPFRSCHSGSWFFICVINLAQVFQQMPLLRNPP